MPRGVLQRLAAAALLLPLSGCGIFGGWFGEAEEPPLPGERLSVLESGRRLEADPAAATLPVILPPARVADWPQAGGGAPHSPGHLALGSSVREVWRADIGEGSGDDAKLLGQPLVAEGVVYALDARERVSARALDSGRELWAVNLKPEEERHGYFGGGLAFAEGRLYVTTGHGAVIALDARDGERLWISNLALPLRAPPTVQGGRVFAVTLESELYALSTEDGRQLWRHSGIQEMAQLLGAASPAASPSSIIAPYASGEIYALLPENGRVLWSDSLAAVRRTAQVGDIAQIRGLPVIDRDLVIAISHSGRLAAIDLRRGLRVWEAEIGGIEMPFVAGDLLFLVSNEAEVVSLTRDRGRLRWVRTLPRFRDPEDREDPIVWSGPVLAGGRLVLANTRGEALFLSPEDGSDVGRLDLPGPVSLSPVVAQDTLIFLTDEAELVAFR